MDERLQQLEQRVAQLEEMVAGAAPATSSGTTLVGPLRIIDSAGRVMLDMGRERGCFAFLRLFNANGIPVVGLYAEGEGGSLAIRDNQGVLVGYLDVEDWGARLQINNRHGEGGVVLFGGESAAEEGGGINILASGRDQRASIQLWANRQGGEIEISGSGETKSGVTMDVTSETGRVIAVDANGNPTIAAT